ncbi:hypothetical protein [Catenuloplanes indicus]|uniref:Uncharacterized protein n=1 Tax=Catenuloplanes indicus TaxID=137267 RepID=A0AAE4B4K7_9ACTN|nr:hypothetical protein [Catenuloplanes indicus]MDQ0371553.1 hypothetical protein [Catenuloplanes indicus]
MSERPTPAADERPGCDDEPTPAVSDKPEHVVPTWDERVAARIGAVPCGWCGVTETTLTGAAHHGAAPHAGTWSLTMPPPAKWLNANDRYKRRPDKEIRAWREAARIYAQGVKLPRLERAHLLVELRFPDARRRDVHNLYPTIKACIDGFVDHGLLPDDSHQYLVGPDLRLGPKCASRPAGIPGELTFTVTDLSADGVCPTCAGTGIAAAPLAVAA